MIRPCDVCIILRRDSSPKEVTWCGPCGKWKCSRCNKGFTGVARSAKAMIKDKLRGSK